MATMPAGQPMHVQQGSIPVPGAPAAYYQMPAYNGVPVVDANGGHFIDPHYYNLTQTSGATTFVQAAPGVPQGAVPGAPIAIASAAPHIQATSAVVTTTSAMVMTGAGGTRTVATVTPTVAVPTPATVTVTPVATIGNPPSVTTSASEVHSGGLKQCDVKANEQVRFSS